MKNFEFYKPLVLIGERCVQKNISKKVEKRWETEKLSVRVPGDVRIIALYMLQESYFLYIDIIYIKNRKFFIYSNFWGKFELPLENSSYI